MNKSLLRSGTKMAMKKMLGGGCFGIELNKEKSNLLTLLGICFVLIATMLFISHRVKVNKLKSENKKPPTMLEFIGIDKKYNMASILVGMASNVIFGFIDNAGLFFGMDALDPFLPDGSNWNKQKGGADDVAAAPAAAEAKQGESLIKAGFGNTFSDFLGSFLGSSFGSIIENLTGIDDTPLWSESIGIVLGCLLGIYIPYYFTGKTHSGGD